jgi:hypothetical protein
MEVFEPPELERRFCCIVPDNNPVVGALVSAYFNLPQTYFPVFTFPNVDKPFANLIDHSQDGYIGQIIGEKAGVFINNAVVRLKPKRVILAGMNDVHKSYIYEHLPKQMLIEIDSETEVKQQLSFLNKEFDGVLPCKMSEIIQGLILARQKNWELQIKESAKSLPKRFLNGGKGLIVLEYSRESQDLAAVNFSLSIGADIALVPRVDRHHVHPVQKLIHEWKEGGSTQSYEKLRRMVTKRLQGINILNYKFCTVFTRGLPYSLILKNLIPITYVLSNIDPDLFIFYNIAYERLPESVDAAVVFSPEFFKGDEETDDVIKILNENNYVVRSLLGASATVKAFEHYASHFPYDVLHVCSHGGETDGYYVIEKFVDRTGKEHTLEYEEIVGFSPAGGDMVEVMRKAIFRRIDGVPWFSNEKNNIPRYVFEDMGKRLFDKEDENKATRVKANYPIYSSCHIKCSDSIHQGNLIQLAARGAPFIFNNTCSSWHEIAVSLIAAGARCYVGTLWKVGTTTARKAAKTFYEDIFSQGNILLAFRKMISGISGGKYEHVYMLWGLHFATLKRPEKKSDQKVFNALVDSFLGWNRKFLENPDPEIKRNCIPVLNFISREIKEKFTPKHMELLASEVKSKIAIERKEEPEDDSIDRGVIEF